MATCTVRTKIQQQQDHARTLLTCPHVQERGRQPRARSRSERAHATCVPAHTCFWISSLVPVLEKKPCSWFSLPELKHLCRVVDAK